MKKSKIYWCHSFSNVNPNQLMGFKPEPLIKVLRKDLDFLDNKDLFSCESVMRDTKNAFVCRTSYDLTIKRVQGTELWVHPDGNPLSNSTNNLLQFHDSYGYVFMSDDVNTELKVLPPFFHDTPFKRGVSGTMNCGKWARIIAPTIINQSDPAIKIKRGDPSMYLYFNKDVEFVQVKETLELQNLVQKCVQVKNVHPNTPLRKLYDMFLNSGYNKIILDEMKRNVI